jgi:hypothetical protein
MTFAKAGSLQSALNGKSQVGFSGLIPDVTRQLIGLPVRADVGIGVRFLSYKPQKVPAFIIQDYAFALGIRPYFSQKLINCLRF